eukprot:1491370-Rhodomonas_salina.1
MNAWPNGGGYRWMVEEGEALVQELLRRVRAGAVSMGGKVSFDRGVPQLEGSCAMIGACAMQWASTIASARSQTSTRCKRRHDRKARSNPGDFKSDR